MTKPTISFLVPTHIEDRPLKRCLDSICDQLALGDEVIVIGDTFDGQLPGVEALVASYGPQFRYLAHDAGCHDYGHSQLNAGIAVASGEWIHINDDDDVWTPGAVSVMRKAAAEAVDRPILFRFLSYHGIVFWVDRNTFEENRIGGHCLLAPNIPGKVGRWTPRYQGDWDYILSTVTLHGGVQSIVWNETIVAIARPS